MRPLNLEFVQRRYASSLGWGLLGLGLALLLVSLLAGIDFTQRTDQLRSNLQLNLELSPEGVDARPTLSVAELREQAAALAEMQRVSAQMLRPWERLFHTLEALPRDDVALLSLNCNASSGKVRFSAEARDFESMLALHRQLEESPDLNDVSLLNHEVVSREGQRPVLFNLLADWEVRDARF
ncbi:MAG: pilus assembly protein [Pseudomonas sp.]